MCMISEDFGKKNWLDLESREEVIKTKFPYWHTGLDEEECESGIDFFQSIIKTN